MALSSTWDIILMVVQMKKCKTLNIYYWRIDLIGFTVQFSEISICVMITIAKTAAANNFVISKAVEYFHFFKARFFLYLFVCKKLVSIFFCFIRYLGNHSHKKNNSKYWSGKSESVISICKPGSCSNSRVLSPSLQSSIF